MDLHERLPHRWLTPKAEPRNLDIPRYGVFAVERIHQGESINVFGGIAVPRSEIGEYRKIISHAGVQVSDDFFVVPSSEDEIRESGIFNHSCEPNVGFNSSVTMVAIRDIEPEEELLMSYAFMETDFDAFKCDCSSRQGRVTITSDTWRDPEFQERYGKYYSPYLKDKFKQ